MCDQYHAKRDASEASGFLMLRLASCCMSAKWVSIFVPFSAHALPRLAHANLACFEIDVPHVSAHASPLRSPIVTEQMATASMAWPHMRAAWP